MAAGVVGTNGLNARRTVVLVIKREIDFATTHHQPLVVMIAGTGARVAQNLDYATRQAAQVSCSAIWMDIRKVIVFTEYALVNEHIRIINLST